MAIYEFVFLMATCVPGAEIAPAGSPEADGCGKYSHFASFYHEDRDVAQQMCLTFLGSMRERAGYYLQVKGETRALKMKCIDERSIP